MDKIAASLAANVAEIRFGDVSKPAIESARRATLDTVGCMLAGSGVNSVQPVVELATAWGGARESRVMGFGGRLPAPLAAFCNGTMARVLEIDDCTDFQPIHPSASAVPALLAVAEARGGVSGKDFLAAIATAQDLIIRLGLAVRVNAMVSGRYNLFKIFAPVAAVARGLRLGVEQTHNALGIAYAYACGEGQSAPEGASSLALQQGIVAQSAIVATLLAEKGNTGSREFLFGRAGFFNAFEPDPVMEPLTEGLGTRFYGEDISIKPYAACRCCHQAIALAQRFFRESGGPVPIAGVRLFVAPNVRDFVGAQIENASDPFSPTAAQFSLPFTVAATLPRGDFFLRELEPGVIADPQIRALANRVEVIADPALSTDPVLGSTALEVTAAGREPFRLEIDQPPGNPSNPLSFEGCVEKARKCTAFSVNPPGPGAFSRFVSRVRKLEDLEDVSCLMEGF